MGLVVTRKLGESLYFRKPGRDEKPISLTIVDVQGNQVKIHIDNTKEEVLINVHEGKREKKCVS